MAVRWTGFGTHTGTLAGAGPTGKRLAFRGIDIIRIEGGRVLERWGESNAAEVLGPS